MHVAVQTEFVSPGEDRFNRSRIAFGHPRGYEEGGPDFEFGQDIEDAIDADLGAVCGLRHGDREVGVPSINREQPRLTVEVEREECGYGLATGPFRIHCVPPYSLLGHDGALTVNKRRGFATSSLSITCSGTPKTSRNLGITLRITWS